jgi:hypothetical protein
LLVVINPGLLTVWLHVLPVADFIDEVEAGRI